MLRILVILIILRRLLTLLTLLGHREQKRGPSAPATPRRAFHPRASPQAGGRGGREGERRRRADGVAAPVSHIFFFCTHYADGMSAQVPQY